MKRNALLTLLAGILFVGIGSLALSTGHGESTIPAQAWWIGFLVLMPLGLAMLVWRKIRWAAMACVIYGTVGLALDLATTVQILTKDSEVFLPLLNSLVSGLLNFLLIVFGGRSFLDLTQAPLPLESRPPNPPSPF
jgi:peptidoglycan/LPS O-acetylase OafA/YrhL